MVVAKKNDVTERMIHTGGEQIQGMRHATLETGDRESVEKGEGVGKLDSTSSLRLDKDQR